MATTVRPVLILYCGLPGAGKTTGARERDRETGAIRFSTDEWMADLGLDYLDPLRDRLQARLDRLWRELLERGQSVILEDGSWTRAERDELRRVARSSGAITELHVFDIPVEELWRRLEGRNAGPGHGEVPITRELLDASRLRFEAPDAAERALFDRCVVHR
ncbi:ATP-binding protein [Leifsonia sp. 1010]|uniref:AAA family ATPase n=1 Tax=Leifsonia sp. 1010 TaxID=2817769 RepID=UPI0028577872|nr:ATP-binding protein [Leifsonia sp. 1010]MDR6611061.1 putative kinase [Leifsonia sp. 1010]